MPITTGTPGSANQELQRLRRAYTHRVSTISPERYSRLNPGHLFGLHEREATMASMLRADNLTSLAGLRILDVGCGRGATLRQYLEYNATLSKMWGIDLFPTFVDQTRSTSPGLQIVCGTASDLPFPDYSFDLVSQFMLFTSVLDLRMRRQMAEEIDRVLAPGGRLLWYDFAFNNPANPDVRGIRLAEVRRLFPTYPLASRRITLAPPLGRAIGRFSPAMYYLVSTIRPLCTHYMCLLRKP